MNALPNSVYFLIAEDMRDEPGNKQTILGFFGGDEVRVKQDSNLKPNDQMVMSSFVIMALLKGQFSNVQTRMKLLSPSKKELLNTKSPDISSGTNNAAVAAVRLAPFHLPELGKYTYELNLNGTVYPYSFEVVSD